MTQSTKRFISVEDYLMGRATQDALPDELVRNLNTLIPLVNDLLDVFYTETGYDKDIKVSSGYRRPEDNAKVPNPKSKSRHLICAAVDLRDVDRKLTNWITDAKLEQFKLYREDPASCPTWAHLQCIPPASGRRTFKP